MSRRKDRSKHKRDEPDAASVPPGILSLHSEKAEESQRLPDGLTSLQGYRTIGLGGMKTLSPMMHLTSESSGSGPSQVDSKSSVTDLLIRLEEKINNLMEKAGVHDSDDREVLEVHAEMQRLLRATVKQKEDFTQLLDIVKRQKQTLKRLEASARSGKLAVTTFEGPEAKLGTAIQCTEDCEDLGAEIDQRVVFLIRGKHEFSRKMSQCGCDYDPLNSIDIPEDMNQGNRMLAGQRDYPHLLLDSSVVDRFVDSKSIHDFNQEPRPTDRKPAGDSDDMFLQCPVCKLTFPAGDASALMLHVNSHFEG